MPAETEELTPTPAAEWPVEPGPRAVRLPSGGVAKLARPSLFLLMRTGRIPPAVAKIMQDNADLPPDDWGLQERALFMEFLIAASFVEPRVSLQPKKGELHIAALSDDDKAAVVTELELRIS